MQRILIIALAYFVTGKLSLLLAIPPGYATAIFPAAGIALAVMLTYGTRALIGVWLGAFLLNLLVSYENNLPVNGLSVLMCSGIGVGAALQAWIATRCIRHYVGFPAALHDLSSIFRFFMFGGPVACLINASISNFILVAGGVLDWNSFGANWFAWWMGDTIGVLLATPWVLSLIGGADELWRKRRSAVAMPTMATLVVIIILFFRVSSWENDRIQFDIEQHAKTTVDRLTTDFLRQLDILFAVKRLFDSSAEVTSEEFKKFIEPAIRTHPTLRAVEWAPHVTDDNRLQFEHLARQHIHPQFIIREREASGTFIPAEQRADYYPILYSEALHHKNLSLGIDLGANSERRSAIERASKLQTAIATQPHVLERHTLIERYPLEESGFLVFLPTRGRDITTASAVNGFAVGVYTLGDLAANFFTPHDRRDFHLRIFSDVDPNQVWLTLPANGNQPTLNTSYRYEVPFDLAGNPLIVEFTPVTHYINERRPWQAWATMAGGLLFTSLLGTFLLFVTGQQARTAFEVERRTRELSSAMSALRENESRLQAVLDTAGDGIIILDNKGLILSANNAATRLLKRSAEELHQQPLAHMLSPSGQQVIDSYILSATPLNTATVKMTEVIRFKNDTVPVTLTISETWLTSGRQFTIILHNMAEQRRIDELKNEFVATVSHELRTPLTSIRGSLGLIAGGIFGNIPDPMQRMLDIAVQNADRLTLLINDILDIEKIESGTMSFNLQLLALCPLIEQAMDVNTGYAKTLGVEMKLIHNHHENAMANIDPDRFLQVMTNLLSNAMKFSPHGGTVEINLCLEKNKIRITVSDRGPGIPEAFAPRIFQKFAQADASSSRLHSGTGLGLSIAKAIVEKLGGEIGFHSKPGEGATFFVLLPVANERSDST